MPRAEQVGSIILSDLKTEDMKLGGPREVSVDLERVMERSMGYCEENTLYEILKESDKIFLKKSNGKTTKE